MIINEISDFCRQYQYLQLEKPSGVEVEISVHKTLAMDFLKGGPLQDPPPLGSDRVKCTDGAISAELLPFYMPCVARGISSSH